ncbi:hypothetical protein QF021_003651 [Acidovorax delafieldii]|uniref:hypothetical protein n=1 Tax=Acidovorax delafieldii TaxID=47920 RepID=UPI0028564CD7|nr:hypothetical protein [Acidovorax delafieldii]MDR6155562.1 hypothetical protein [Acidovorax delafieldii]
MRHSLIARALPSATALSNNAHTVAFQVADNGEEECETALWVVAGPFTSKLFAPYRVCIPVVGIAAFHCS